MVVEKALITQTSHFTSSCSSTIYTNNFQSFFLIKVVYQINQKMGYWKSTVVPKFKKIFEKNNTKKTAAAEACKSFDDSKEEYIKEFEEKKTELQTKVIEIYEASTAEIKELVKGPKDASLKKSSNGVTNFLEELSKIDFPGSKSVHEACTKFGPTLVQGPVFFVFEKVSTFIVVEEKEKPISKDKDVAVEEEKKEEAAVKSEAKVATEEVATPAEPPQAC